MSPRTHACDVFQEMCEDLRTDHEPKTTRLRTFRSSSDLPYLVLPGPVPESASDRFHETPGDEHPA